MTRAENWQLVLRICEETQDGVIASLRIALLNDLGKTEEFTKSENLKHYGFLFRAFVTGRKRAAICQVPPGKVMVLFPGASGSNVLNLMPVVQEAYRRGSLGGIAAAEAFELTSSKALDGFENVMAEKSLRSLAGFGFLPKSLRRSSRRMKDLIQRLSRHNPQCARQIKTSYAWHLRLMVISEAMGIAYHKLLSAWRPAVLLSTSDFWPTEFQCCWQARRLGIKTAILQHGVLSDVSVWPIYHDSFLAWGESFREQIMKLGAPSDRITVLGMPASDDLFGRSTGRPDHLVRNGKPPVCLLLSHTQDRIEEEALFKNFGAFLATAVREMPHVNWAIRLHPSEDDSFYRESDILKFKNVSILPREMSLEQSVESATTVATIRSTAGMQAMMMNKPLLLLHLLPSSPPFVSWPQEGGGIYVRTAAEFEAHLSRLSTDPEFERFLLASQERFLNKTFANRGRAATAIVDYLEQQMSQPVSYK